MPSTYVLYLSNERGFDNPLHEEITMRFVFNVLLILFLLTPLPIAGHEGHDHAAPPPLPVQALAPRVVIQSEELEFVGIVQDQQLVIYLDSLATNEPITQAKIEVESGNFKAIAQATSTGTYLLPASQLLTPGKHELVLTIEAGTLSDLLLGELNIPAVASSTQQMPPNFTLNWNAWEILLHAPPILQVILSVLFVLVLILLAMIYFCKSRRSQETLSSLAMIGVMLFLGGGLLLFSSSSFAHEGETHEEDKPVAPNSLSSDAPSRLADGRIFVPKPAQRLLGIRTLVAKTDHVSPRLELNGHIIPDPNYSGRVQAPLAGELELVSQGLPNLGEPVEKNQILAYLNVINNNVDQADRQAELANLSGQIDNVHNNLERLKKLGYHAARKELDEMTVELNSLQARREVIERGLSMRIPLIAPVAGVIATRNAFPGQVVEARDILFEIVNPKKFWVEALVYETALAEQLGQAQAITASHQVLSLTLMGLPYQLREHALPVQFRIESPLPLLSVAQPVKVLVQTKQSLAGIRLPNLAVLKGNHNDNLVWIHEQPEYFKPVNVRVQVIDGNQVVVTAGLQAGDRVVVQGATLLNQIR